MLEVNKLFNKLAIIEVPSDRKIAISYDKDESIINIIEDDSNKVVSSSLYSFAEYLAKNNININNIEKVSQGMYKIN